MPSFAQNNCQTSFSDDFFLSTKEIYSIEDSNIIRQIVRRSGKNSQSSLKYCKDKISKSMSEKHDLSWLRSADKPKYIGKGKPLRVVDLFCGCGGLTLGIEEACRALNIPIEHVFASDIEKKYLDVYLKNFNPTFLENRPIEMFIDSSLGQRLSKEERKIKKMLGEISLVVGGPPCQGHSDLNNYTRRSDPKNLLFMRMARFAEVVEPEHIIIENVPGVKHDQTGVFESTIEAIQKLGYRVDYLTIRGEEIGVPQSRRRVFIIASLSAPIDEGSLEISVQQFKVDKRSVGWACNDLLDIKSNHPFNQSTELSEISKERINWLFDNNEYDLPNELRPDCHKKKSHTYNSVYGRLYWDRPSQTITTGFSVMGQGRYVHPIRKRIISPHEAARIQFFPDFFSFGSHNRKEYSKMIGNAVPPKMAYIVGLELLR